MLLLCKSPLNRQCSKHHFAPTMKRYFSCAVHHVEDKAPPDLGKKILFYPRATLHRHEKQKYTKQVGLAAVLEPGENLQVRQKFISNFHPIISQSETTN